MRVTNIEVSGLHFDGVAHVGHVSMKICASNRSDNSLHFLCRVNQPEDCPSTLVLYDLITDALRQARRMPGFRNGEEEIKVDLSQAKIAAA
ncbi:hypothetical protein [Aliiroseovarius subalbicans]|uniref:hypothetical protein n=1 Tax=Aliiroseovarius subalbicans TaxID=2925840 RepID=UPI001F581C70|nr:hypothetical protein [Aliiroseovarius subalbicans]MCI2399810.1 hypothetical protein [Aliiroseovarius subalbicans]